MFLTIDKFKKRVEELKGRRYVDAVSIAPFASREGERDKDEWYHELPGPVEGSPFGVGDVLKGRDHYLWLETETVLLQKREGMEVLGIFDFGENDFGNKHGVEALLYVDGHPYQGVDINHSEVFFDGLEGQKVRLTFLLWSGLEGGQIPQNFYHRCQRADLAYLHKSTDQLYYFARAITESLELMSPDQEQYEDLKGVLERTLAYINWDADAFYASADQAYEVLKQELNRLEKRTDVTVHVVGHTHIDVAWLWRFKHTREKCQRSFATVLHLMEKYDEYQFLQTQPQLYQYIKEDVPELYDRIRARIADGHWEVDGGMWVEADCNLSSGESLVRQFLLGTRFIEREFGKKCEYLWLPDVFGYSWALPQILKQCEITTFMTTKISWNQFNTIPDDLFWWKGIDGTKIMTYFVDTPADGKPVEARFSTYNGVITPRSVMGNWKKFKNKELSKETLLSYGYGDGGGGVNRDMLELRRAMDVIPGIPHVKPSSAGAFFRRMHEKLEKTDRYVHTWDGELYLEYHRGTYTSQAYNKKMNRYLENYLAQTEWLASMAYLQNGRYDREKLNQAWECILLHQFHDVIPGSSIREVYQDSRINYERALETIDQVRAETAAVLTASDDFVYSIYSTNSFGGKELVTIPVCEAGYFADEDGKVLPAARTKDGYEVLTEVRPFGVAAVRFIPETEPPCPCSDSPFIWKNRTLDTPYYHIVWNQAGQISFLYDKEAGRQVLREGEAGNVLEVYEDRPLNYDAWDVDIFHVQKMEEVSAAGEPEVLEQNGLKITLLFSYRYHNSVIRQKVMLYRDSRRIDFVTKVDWQEDHRLLKVAFHTDIRATKATYDIQFGHVERPTHWSNSWDWARFEVCGHKWADLSEYGYGVSLLNTCKYGHSIKDHVMRLTLLKSAKYPDAAADMGEHTFTYALYPHRGSLMEGGTVEEANRLNLPAQVMAGRWKDERKIVEVSSPQVQIDAVKLAEDEDCLIVRMHECRGGQDHVIMRSQYDVSKIVPCNLLEHDCGEAVMGKRVEFVIRPFEIRTWKLYLGKQEG